MTENKQFDSSTYLDKARELVRQLEAGNQAEAERLVDAIAKEREESLFQELGKLTREFHEALNSFRLDSRITTLAEEEIPDARDRLTYVITMTEQAADRTLNAVEESLPVCERIESISSELSGQWERFMRREMDADEFRALSRELLNHLGALPGDTAKLRANLQDVLMAQDFQDLTGQIIRRVITLVEDLEKSLVELIRISGQNLVPPGQLKEPDKKESKEKGEEDVGVHGPAVPGVDTGVVSGQDEVDDLLSSLGF